MEPQGNGHNRHASTQVGQRVENLSESARALFTEAKGTMNELNDFLDLSGRVRRHPYRMLAIAAGVGYVLGGGLFTPATGRLFKLGLRLAAIPLVKDELLAMLDGAVRGYTQATESNRSPPSST